MHLSTQFSDLTPPPGLPARLVLPADTMAERIRALEAALRQAQIIADGELRFAAPGLTRDALVTISNIAGLALATGGLA